MSTRNGNCYRGNLNLSSKTPAPILYQRISPVNILLTRALISVFVGSHECAYTHRQENMRPSCQPNPMSVGQTQGLSAKHTVCKRNIRSSCQPNQKSRVRLPACFASHETHDVPIVRAGSANNKQSTEAHKRQRRLLYILLGCIVR